MHLLIVMAFGLLIGVTDQRPFAPPVENAVWTIVVVVAQILIWWTVGRWCSNWAVRKLSAPGDTIDVVQFTYHRVGFVLRILVFAGFGADLLLTRWPELIHALSLIPAWSGLGDLVIISPLFLTLLAVWHALYPIDRKLRASVARHHLWDGVPRGRVWTLREYLSFNTRYHILTVLVPVAIVLLTYRLCDYHRAWLVDALLFPWVPDAILGLVAATVFVISPLLLKTVWKTSPLADGPLRRRLEDACERLGLKCKDILLWDSCGMMINAAVMGVFARFRYVLLSDGLLNGLTDLQIEAVFGHETGHVRHHHVQYFLLFALVSVLLVSGVMEVVVWLAHGPERIVKLSDTAIQGIGLGFILLVWGVAFGWLSRRFERQSDAFGARCVSPAGRLCGESCGVHPFDGGPAATGDPICVAGAKMFVSALDQVAALNGIPPEERSWRHSSIASRMRFLIAQAGDPKRATAFSRLVRNLKRGLWIAAVAGGLATIAYCLWHPGYREVIIQNTIQPLREAEWVGSMTH